jgi:hypothetical protein
MNARFHLAQVHLFLEEISELLPPMLGAIIIITSTFPALPHHA